jgi:hypothetical protein
MNRCDTFDTGPTSGEWVCCRIGGCCLVGKHIVHPAHLVVHRMAHPASSASVNGHVGAFGHESVLHRWTHHGRYRCV